MRRVGWRGRVRSRSVGSCGAGRRERRTRQERVGALLLRGAGGRRTARDRLISESLSEVREAGLTGPFGVGGRSSPKLWPTSDDIPGQTMRAAGRGSERTLPLQLLIRLDQQVKVAIARMLLDPRLDLLQCLLLDRLVRRAVVDEPDEGRGERFTADFAMQGWPAVRDEGAGELWSKDMTKESVSVSPKELFTLFTRASSLYAP